MPAPIRSAFLLEFTPIAQATALVSIAPLGSLSLSIPLVPFMTVWLILSTVSHPLASVVLIVISPLALAVFLGLFLLSGMVNVLPNGAK